MIASIKRDDTEHYSEVANAMQTLAAQQPGYLGAEFARNEIGITVSYWISLEAIHNWKQVTEHALAQQLGKEAFYSAYTVRVCLVEKAYHFKV
jgi:heme-degrading monooxygenase HmoA